MRKRSAGILLSYVGTAVNMICGLALSSFLLRTLGDTEYGIYQTIASFVNYLVLLEFGTGTVMTRNISLCRGQGLDNRAAETNASTIWTITGGLALGIALAALVFYWSIDTVFAVSMTPQQLDHAGWIFLVSALYLIVSFLMQTVNGVILAFEYYTYASCVNIIRSVLKLALLMLIIGKHPNAVYVAGVDLCLAVLCLAYGWFFVTRKLGLHLRMGVFDKAVFRSSAPLCLAIFLQAIVNQANNNVDKFLIGIKLTPESVSLYSVGLYVFSIFSSLTTIPISMYVPSVTRYVARSESPEELAEHLVEPCRLTALIGGAVLFGFAAVGREFITILYGERYLLAWVIALIIMAPMYLNMITGVLVNVLDALNKRMIRSVALLVTTAANILLTIFWLDLWGPVGAAMATAVCTLVGQVGFMNLYYRCKLKLPVLRLYVRALSGTLPSLILGCAAGFAAASCFKNVWLSFFAGGFAFILAAAGVFIPFGTTRGEKAALTNILHRGKET